MWINTRRVSWWYNFRLLLGSTKRGCNRTDETLGRGEPSYEDTHGSSCVNPKTKHACPTSSCMFRKLALPWRSDFKSLSLLFQYGRIYCDAFISGGLPMLPALFKQDHKKGHEFLKPFQLVTRKLQHVCSHSKVRTQVSLRNCIFIIASSNHVSYNFIRPRRILCSSDMCLLWRSV